MAATVYLTFGKFLKKINVVGLVPLNVTFQFILFIAKDVASFGFKIAGIVFELIK